MTSAYSSGFRLPGLSIGIFDCMVLNRSSAVLASHAPRKASPLNSAGLWHDAQEAVNTTSPRAACPSVYTPSQTDRSDCDRALKRDRAPNTRTNAIIGFIRSLFDHARLRRGMDLQSSTRVVIQGVGHRKL